MIDTEMTEWALVVTNGVRLIGALRGEVLSPAYEIDQVSAIMPTQGGAPQIHTIGATVMPFCGVESYDSLKVPTGAIVKPLRELSAENRSMLRKMVEAYEAKLRKHQSGLVIASADALNGQAARVKPRS